jgi:hypothetical protein
MNTSKGKNEVNKMNKDKIIQILAKNTAFFMEVGIIYWGWTILCPHLNAPQFSYWEIIVLYMGYNILRIKSK